MQNTKATKKAANKANVKAAKKAPAVTTTATDAEAAPKAKIQRFTHNIAGSYNGLSQSFGKKRSATPINTRAFDTMPDAMLTPRDNAFLADIKAAYKSSEFKRGDLDAGNMRRAIERGFITYVSGNLDGNGYTTGADSLFKLTEKALKQKFA